MNDSRVSVSALGSVRVEILGRTDYMEQDRLEMIGELSEYMRGEGLTADIYYREPGGMGPPPLEVITIFIGTNIASALIGAAAVASIKAAVAWARERIRRHFPASVSPDADFVQVTLYGPNGEFLKHVRVTRDSVGE